MLDVRTFGWFSRRLGRVYAGEFAWRSRRRLGHLRR